ncbi:MAG: DJ-1/PfpI family protein [Ruminococcaceae bacterium]|nr:DJ-1/PfpI family protein [Oscillospiraceae bacterium]
MVYVFLADGFEEIEALTPIDMLKRAGIPVKSVSINKDETVIGAHGIKVIADQTIDNTPIEDIDMVVLPGGLPGADNLRENQKVQMFIDKANEQNKYICAICAAPRILGEKGLLDGKKATCYPGFEKYLKGADLSQSGCVVDGNFITAMGMGKSIDFSAALITALKDADTADKIKKAIFA